MDYERKKSGHIPAFGNWDYANDLPITKYFECARQAGLIRPSSSSSSCRCGPCVKARRSYRTDDVYTYTNTDTSDSRKAPIRVVAVPPTKTINRVKNYEDMRPPKVKERKNEVRISTKKQQQQQEEEERPTSPQCINVVKPMDEDLYKIPSNLLHNNSTKKKKRMLGFFSRCLVPPCRA